MVKRKQAPAASKSRPKSRPNGRSNGADSKLPAAATIAASVSPPVPAIVGAPPVPAVVGNPMPASVSAGVDSADFGVLREVPMTVQVEIGRTVMTLGDILDELEVGSNIRLDRHAGDPVEVYVNGALFARAEVVVVQDQIGARIIELLGPGQATRPSGLL
jgi:flagellar motor switch protein FliN/FliY